MGPVIETREVFDFRFFGVFWIEISIFDFSRPNRMLPWQRPGGSILEENTVYNLINRISHRRWRFCSWKLMCRRCTLWAFWTSVEQMNREAAPSLCSSTTDPCRMSTRTATRWNSTSTGTRTWTPETNSWSAHLSRTLGQCLPSSKLHPTEK